VAHLSRPGRGPCGLVSCLPAAGGQGWGCLSLASFSYEFAGRFRSRGADAEFPCSESLLPSQPFKVARPGPSCRPANAACTVFRDLHWTYQGWRVVAP